MIDPTVGFEAIAHDRWSARRRCSKSARVDRPPFGHEKMVKGGKLGRAEGRGQVRHNVDRMRPRSFSTKV
jgi:hypothetical protein